VNKCEQYGDCEYYIMMCAHKVEIRKIASHSVIKQISEKTYFDFRDSVSRHVWDKLESDKDV